MISLFVIWGSVYQTTIDQEAIRQGSIAAKTISDSIISELQNEDLYSAEYKYAIIGNPIDNPLVYVNSIYSKSNAYAKLIGPYWRSGLDSKTWVGIFRNLSGVNLVACTSKEYEEILVNSEINGMNVFPKEGSIKELNGIIVIKVSSW